MENRLRPSSKEFLRRTMSAIEQYSDYLPRDEKSYSHTLFLNACVGLLMVPEAELYNTLPEQRLNDLGIGVAEDLFPANCRTLREIVRHLRNSISHSHFEFDCRQGVILDNITFLDIYNGRETFRATLSFTDFKKIVLYVVKFAIGDDNNSNW